MTLKATRTGQGPVADAGHLSGCWGALNSASIPLPETEGTGAGNGTPCCEHGTHALRTRGQSRAGST